tara:strand:+ start:59 stop:427 length:369 start_codon:yes stop_codon:yes gene_type:complete
MRITIIALVAFVLGTLVDIPYKFAIRYFFHDQYGRLVYLCDSAMRSHYIAKNQVLEEPSSENLDELEIAEVALIDCQEYDILRKKLLSFGLNEADLSLISLKYIEEKSSDLMDIVNIHEIKY